MRLQKPNGSCIVIGEQSISAEIHTKQSFRRIFMDSIQFKSQLILTSIMKHETPLNHLFVVVGLAYI